jgi:hypothetical protein
MSTLLTLPCDPALQPAPVAISPVGNVPVDVPVGKAPVDKVPIDKVPIDTGPAAAEDKVRQQVWGLLAGLHTSGKWTERRSVQRFPLARLIRLSPVGPDGVTPLPESLVVVGKDVSERGLGFFHLQPLPHRRMVASIETHSGDWIGFLIDISWCRFTHHGWYDSGGRFLQVVEAEGEGLGAGG